VVLASKFYSVIPGSRLQRPMQAGLSHTVAPSVSTGSKLPLIVSII